MQWFVLLVMCGGLLGVGAPAALAAGTTNALAAGVAAFDAAFDAWSYEGFVAAADRFAAEARINTTSFPALYWQGVAEFHAVLWRRHAGGTAARDGLAGRFQQAGAAFEAALRLKPDDAECHALLGALTGMQIADHPASAVWRGSRALRHQRLALRNGSDNPRVHYLVGSGYYHAPAFLGDRRQALTHFLKAEALFDCEAAVSGDPLQPRWGRSSCLTFIGKFHEQAGDRLRAESYYRKALSANPRDKLAQEALGGRGH